MKKSSLSFFSYDLHFGPIVYIAKSYIHAQAYCLTLIVKTSKSEIFFLVNCILKIEAKPVCLLFSYG
jgi:hypothetical protein